jgi:hypothetical protein
MLILSSILHTGFPNVHLHSRFTIKQIYVDFFSIHSTCLACIIRLDLLILIVFGLYPIQGLFKCASRLLLIEWNSNITNIRHVSGQHVTLLTYCRHAYVDRYYYHFNTEGGAGDIRSINIWEFIWDGGTAVDAVKEAGFSSIALQGRRVREIYVTSAASRWWCSCSCLPLFMCKRLPCVSVYRRTDIGSVMVTSTSLSQERRHWFNDLVSSCV